MLATVDQWTDVGEYLNRKIKRPYHCRGENCGRMLFVGYLAPGTEVEIRCPKCGRIVVCTNSSQPDEGEVHS